MTTYAASHIVAAPGDKRTLCGAKSSEVGLCWAKYVQAHTDGWNPTWCPECLALWREMSTDR